MLRDPAQPDRILIELSDLESGAPLDTLEPARPAFDRVVSWSREYLCRPHGELGRSGPVCPYVQRAMDKGLFFLTACPGTDLDAETIVETVKGFRDWFLDLEPREGNEAFLKTILVLFPDLSLEDAPRLIDGTQGRLKAEYVARGLMIGEFHAGPPPKAGLWNSAFRPLSCPVPLLAIRHMVATDFPFLREDPDLIRTYLSIYQDQVPPHVRRQVQEAADRFGISTEGFGGAAAVHPKVRAALKQAGAPYRVHRHADQPIPIDGPHDFARALGYPVARITKSLFLRCPTTHRYLVVVCSANRRVNLRRVAERAGLKRLELASPEELGVLLGYPPGGIPPVAVGGLPVYMDEGLFEFETVLIAGGEVEVEIELAPEHLRRVARAEVISLRQEVPA